ncbi:MAG TPA: peptidoglycan DD-metalloendopeptidase family protein [Vicinamibacterales bacterium]
MTGSRIGFALPIGLLLALALTATPDGARQDAQQRAAERLRALQREAETLAAQGKTLLVELRRLEVERAIRLEELRTARAELAQVTSDLEAATVQLEALERAHAEQVPGLAARLADIYKMGSGGYVRLLLSVGDLRDLGRAYRTVASLAARDRERVRAYQSTLESLRAARAGLAERRERAAALEADAREAAAAAARAVEARTALLARIDAERDLNAQLAGELQLARERLEQAVTALDRSATAPALPFRPFRGALDWPATGRVQAFFGRPARDGRGARNGIEIAVPADTPVQAVHDGTVAFAGPFEGFGNLVILDHGARAYTLYGYLASIDVTKDSRVGKGARLGLAGLPPAGGTPVVYFEVRIDGQAADPLQWLKPRRPPTP